MFDSGRMKVSLFKCKSMLEVKRMDDSECYRKAVNGKRGDGPIKSFENTNQLNLDYSKILHCGILV